MVSFFCWRARLAYVNALPQCTLHTSLQKYITTMQLVQFALSFVASVYYVRYANDGRGCYGNSFGAFEFTLACNISFFFLFAMFYVKSYGGKPAAKKKD